jgi:transposase-like protein
MIAKRGEMARKGYPAEFRKRVLELVEGGRRVAEVAAELEISQQTIYAWRRRHLEPYWANSVRRCQSTDVPAELSFASAHTPL